jgi:hypothetical protein
MPLPMVRKTENNFAATTFIIGFFGPRMKKPRYSTVNGAEKVYDEDSVEAEHY